MFDLKAYLTQKREQINAALNRLLLTDPISPIVEAMRHSLMAGGKRIRPILCIAGTEAVGSRGDDVLPIACALEMIHTYSLIHDDLPAMDNDDLRRGIPTCHKAYNEATAILAGDALLTLAFEILSSIPCTSDLKALQLLEVIHMIAKAAGYRGMIEGQMRDIASEGTELSKDALEELHSLKTGCLIEVSVCVGAVFSGASPEQMEHLKRYAGYIGLAFQITDDILNVEGNPAVMGKAVGTDHARKKSTYPSVLGIEASKAYAYITIQNALSELDSFDAGAEPLRAIAQYVIDRKR